MKPLGDTTTAHGSGGAGRPVGVRVADARHHLHVIGATGSGKSTLLSQLILDDIHHGRGVVVIDPKGDLITDITARLPRRLLREAVLIDPDRPAAAPNLNPLTTAIRRPAVPGPGAESENGRALAVENLVTICRRVFTGYWGPRTDDLMRAVCLTLIAQPTPRTLADLPDAAHQPGRARPRPARHRRRFGVARVLDQLQPAVRTRPRSDHRPADEPHPRPAAAPLRPRPAHRTPHRGHARPA